MTSITVSANGKIARPIGRPRAALQLTEADKMRSQGQSWSEISRTLGIHRNTLLNHRRGGYSARMVSLPQKKLLRMASRFLKADSGEGLTRVEFKDARSFVYLLRLLSTENEELREALGKARQAIRDYERILYGQRR